MTRPPIVVRRADAADRPLVAGILARAFIDDPAMAWLLPDRAGRAPRLMALFGAIARIDADPALWSLAGDAGAAPVAVALWRKPGAWRAPFSATLRELPALARAFGLGLPRALRLQSAMDGHHPDVPHWYLQFVGCSPQAQGKGYGGAAIRARLAQCDAEGLPAALETATQSNVELYRALGFEVTDRYRHRDGPDFWAMWRPARAAG